MTVLLEQFVQTLCDSGLMAEAEVQKFLGRLSDGDKPKDGQEMATLLYRQGKLTKFQAQAVYRGKAKGLILGDYVLLDKIGQGGMGQVYKAQHRRMKRIVAVKILPTEMTKSQDAVDRFQQEVEAAARLIHPNVATAFDAGEARNTHFLVMEHVDGKDLAAVVAEREPLSVADAVNYVLQAAHGLAYAHSEGVIHRDIKPSNLLLDKKGIVKILDMGLARADHKVDPEGETADRGLTQSGDVMGTVDFMSPEQAASTKHVDERADIYSLGCTLFYLLNGRAVYDGDTLVQRVMAHREKSVPNLHKVRDDVPQSLANVFRKMVGKKPEFRYRSMQEVITALESCDLPRGPRRGTAPTTAFEAVPETSTPDKTMAAKSLPNVAGAAPPPPDVTPRDRTPVRPDPTVRRQKTLATAKSLQKQKERKRVWSDAVDDALREQKSRARWHRVSSIVRGGISGFAKCVLLLAFVGGLGYGGYYVWRNNRQLEQSRQRVKDAVNQTLGQTTFDQVPTLEFSDTSFARPVPPTLIFERPLFQTNDAGRRQAATLTGQFDRVAGIVRIQTPFQIQINVEPVP